MTDVEITRLCAEAIKADGLIWPGVKGSVMVEPEDGSPPYVYDPLHDDTQAMALLRQMIVMNDNERWEISNHVIHYQHREFTYTQLGGFFRAEHLNRAICECAAKRQQARTL